MDRITFAIFVVASSTALALVSILVLISQVRQLRRRHGRINSYITQLEAENYAREALERVAFDNGARAYPLARSEASREVTWPNEAAAINRLMHGSATHLTAGWPPDDDRLIQDSAAEMADGGGK